MIKVELVQVSCTHVAIVHAFTLPTQEERVLGRWGPRDFDVNHLVDPSVLRSQHGVGEPLGQVDKVQPADSAGHGVYGVNDLRHR